MQSPAPSAMRSIPIIPTSTDTMASGTPTPIMAAHPDEETLDPATPDEWAALHPELGTSTRRLQARPNVIFEAGLAFG